MLTSSRGRCCRASERSAARTTRTVVRRKVQLAVRLRKEQGLAPTADILTRLSVPFETLLANSEVKDLAGVRVPLASIDDLIALKTGTGRAIDASDIEALGLLQRMRGTAP